MESGGACGNCKAPARMRCSRCLSICYCSRDCQKMHWNTHKSMCNQQQLHKPSGPKTEGPCATCHAPAATKCSHCRQVFYCSRECQQRQWKQHRTNCFPFKVEESPELGRYMMATKPIRAGETIISKEEPLVLSPLEPRTAPCLGCYRPVDGGYRCRRCSWPLCGPECELSPDHLPECELSRSNRREVEGLGIDSYGIVMVIRCLALKKCPEKYEKLLKLQNHNAERKANVQKMAVEKEIAQILKKKFHLQYESNGKDDSLEKFVSHVMGAVDVNGFEIFLGDTDIMGLYPWCSMMEHSCTPNTALKFSSSHQLTIKATVDINEGDHISNTYTEILLGTMARRKHLLEHKYFLCNCKRCADATEMNTFFSALRCDKCTDGYLLPAKPLALESKWVCTSCHESISSSDANHNTKALEDKMESVMAKPNLESLEKFVLDCSTQNCHYNHYLLFKARHTLIQLYDRGPTAVKEETLRKKEKLCQELLEICSAFDPSDARVGSYTGVILFEYHEAVMIRAQKLAREEFPDQKKVDQCIAAAKALLQKCIKVLQDEPEELPEGKLKVIAQRKLTEIGLLTAAGK